MKATDAWVHSGKKNPKTEQKKQNKRNPNKQNSPQTNKNQVPKNMIGTLLKMRR